MEVLILAGGKGTRLKSVVSDKPKCLASVNNKPFIAYVIAHFEQAGATQFVFSLGYLHEQMEAAIALLLPKKRYKLSVETQPLGTGGAIALALNQCQDNHICIANGDTLFKVDTQKLAKLHQARNADCTLALKPMQHFDRYGAVHLDQSNKILAFEEKKYRDKGYINGGVYILNKQAFQKNSFPASFSFETDYLQKKINSIQAIGCVCDDYFVDIGIPSDYAQAQLDLANE